MLGWRKVKRIMGNENSGSGKDGVALRMKGAGVGVWVVHGLEMDFWWGFALKAVGREGINDFVGIDLEGILHRR